MVRKTYWHGSNEETAEKKWHWHNRKADSSRAISTGDGRLESKPRNKREWLLQSCSKPSGKQMSPRTWPPLWSGLQTMLLMAILFSPQSSMAAFIAFENCLDPSIINSNPQTLQFFPLFVWASFDSSLNGNGINVTAFGNVAGIATQQSYPNISDPQWQNPNDTVGKIPDVAGIPGQEKYTTFTTQFNVLDYTPYNPPATRFCNSSAITACPLAPVFNFTGNT